MLVAVRYTDSFGLHILQGSSPSACASDIEMDWETFSTILQVAKWYFFPDGVL